MQARRTPLLPPCAWQSKRSVTQTPFFTPQPHFTPATNTPGQIVKLSSPVVSKKIRTPMSARKAGGRKQLGIWKRLAKRRLFGE